MKEVSIMERKNEQPRSGTRPAWLWGFLGVWVGLGLAWGIQLMLPVEAAWTVSAGGLAITVWLIGQEAWRAWRRRRAAAEGEQLPMNW